MVSWEKNIFLWKKTYNSWPFSLMQSYLLLKRFMQNFPQSNEIFFGHVTADILAPFSHWLYYSGLSQRVVHVPPTLIIKNLDSPNLSFSGKYTPLSSITETCYNL